MQFFVIFFILIFSTGLTTAHANTFNQSIEQKFIKNLKTNSRIAVLQLYDGKTGNHTALGDQWRDRLENILNKNSFQVIPRNDLKALMDDVSSFAKDQTLDDISDQLQSETIITGRYYIKAKTQKMELHLKALDTIKTSMLSTLNITLSLPDNWQSLNKQIRGNRYNNQNAGNLANKIDDIMDGLAKLTQSFENLQNNFSKLAKSGGLIDKPTNPAEFYANARLYEQRGDLLNAGKSYFKFFKFNLAFLDPHIRYQKILKIEEGRAGAREIYAEMKHQFNNPTVEFAYNLLLTSRSRKNALTDFAEKHPEFSPVFYQLSQEYSEIRLGHIPSLQDKKKQSESLQKFLDQHKKNQVMPYFLDKSMASEWLTKSEEQLKRLGFINKNIFKNPVTFTASRSNSGWTVNVNIAETATKILYKIGNDTQYHDNGTYSFVNPMTGLPNPKTIITLPKRFTKVKIFVKYKDVSGKLNGPFIYDFNQDTQFVTSYKSILEMIPNSWVSINMINNKPSVYFTTLISYRCALTTIKYGINTMKPNKIWSLEPCNKKSPNSVAGKIYGSIPDDTQYISIKLFYKDGTTSKVQRIDR
ncbi:MAG: hypothetical protein HN826_15000 [Methylococcales bacterium]|nr:hypothetical protein [Methylococcales bacterium]